MSITKKAISIGLSGAMLASLAATVVAPAALASTTVAGVGVVPVGGSSTANNLQITFQEQAAASIPLNGTGSGSFNVYICDGKGFGVFPACVDTGTVSFIGTPSTAASTGSLGASASVTGNMLHVSISGADTANVESIIVTGLGIKATTGAYPGVIAMQMDAGTGVLAGAPGIFQAGGTASGVFATGVSIGATSATINVTTTGCAFVATGTGTPASGKFAFAAGVAPAVAESLSGTAGPLNTPLAGQQVLTITTVGGFTSIHNAGDVVTQTNACGANGVLQSPGTIANGLLLSSDVVQVFPGESNQDAGTVYVDETAAGTLGTSTPDTVTLTITTPGVQFSSIPDWNTYCGLTFKNSPSMNAARTAVTWTVNTVSTTFPATNGGTCANDSMYIYPSYDVASTVTNGTNISVSLSTTAGPVSPTSTVNAEVGRIFTATATPPIPNVYIGQNGQKTALVTVTEVAAGSFTAGAGPINQIEICLNSSSDSWYTGVPPYAKVTVGDLALRNGTAAAAPGTAVAGTLGSNGCYQWYVWTASTVASTIVIGGDTTFAFGPYVSVSPLAVPGPLNLKVYADSSANPLYGPNVTVQIANRIFQNSVVVTALKQPYVAPGSGDALVGSLQISETAMGQLKPYERICVVVLPRATNGLRTQDTLINWLTTANVPVATASNGVTIGSVNLDSSCVSQSQDGGPSQPSIFPYLPIPTGYTNAFSFTVTQQSTTGNGMITINNIHYSVTADAPAGPVQVEVFGFGASNTQVQFDSTVSNAIVGTVQPTFLDASSATGVTTTNSAFSLSTKVVKKGSYVTVMIKTTPALGGAHVGIYIAKKGADGKWSAFSPHTGRIANGSGVVYYYYKAGSVAWLSIRGYYAGSGTHAAAWSNAVQVKFTK